MMTSYNANNSVHNDLTTMLLSKAVQRILTFEFDSIKSLIYSKRVRQI